MIPHWTPAIRVWYRPVAGTARPNALAALSQVWMATAPGSTMTTSKRWRSLSRGTHSVGPVPAMPALFTSPAILASAGILSGFGRSGAPGAVGGVEIGRAHV